MNYKALQNAIQAVTASAEEADLELSDREVVRNFVRQAYELVQLRAGRVYPYPESDKAASYLRKQITEWLRQYRLS